VTFAVFYDAKGERIVEVRREFLAGVLGRQDIHRTRQNGVSSAMGKRHETPYSILSMGKSVFGAANSAAVGPSVSRAGLRRE
jgi:hypothetical protein